jgi:hypothetical protein
MADWKVLLQLIEVHLAGPQPVTIQVTAPNWRSVARDDPDSPTIEGSSA